MTPFIVYALPRSRTAWLSRFLTYGDVTCGHEQARYMRGVEDVRSWLSQDRVGTVETAAAPWWRLVKHLRPDVRVVVVRRPVDEVVDSLMSIDMRGEPEMDHAAIARRVHTLDAYLDRIEREHPDALVVPYSSMGTEDGCARLWRHVMPYPHDPVWWDVLNGAYIAGNVPMLTRYTLANAGQIRQTIERARRYMFGTMLLSPLETDDGLVIEEEGFGTYFNDAQALFAEHCEAIGEAPDEYLHKNTTLWRDLCAKGAGHVITARLNGRMFGYVAFVVGPTMEKPNEQMATIVTVYGSPVIPGLGMRLHRAAVEWLRSHNVWRASFRAGVRGSGPRMGTLYRRLGAVEDGTMFTLTLKDA